MTLLIITCVFVEAMSSIMCRCSIDFFSGLFDRLYIVHEEYFIDINPITLVRSNELMNIDLYDYEYNIQPLGTGAVSCLVNSATPLSSGGVDRPFSAALLISSFRQISLSEAVINKLTVTGVRYPLTQVTIVINHLM